MKLSRSKLSLKNRRSIPTATDPSKIGAIRQPSLKANIEGGRSNVPTLVAIGASAGGPKALATILAQLPQNFGAAVAITQHIDAQFAPGLANWLNQQTPLTVEVAKVGDQPQVGKVLLAGRNDHLILRSHLRFSYSADPQDDPCRPSVNALFTSVAQHWPSPSIAVLLTGMGSDGAIGLKSLRSQGWHTIAQDRNSCAVYGMPKAAVKLEAAVEVLPLEAIGKQLIKLVASNRSKFVPTVRSKTYGE